MVVQCGEPVAFWGWADEGEEVIIRQGGEVLATTSGAGSKTPWKVLLPAFQAGPVKDIEVLGRNTVRLTNILSGEVWLCSGQSNMSMTMEPGPWCSWSGGVVDHAKEVKAATDGQIRVFTVTSTSSRPRPQAKGEWLVCSPQTAPSFSAVAYYFAAKLRGDLWKPVGVVVSAVGGTDAELWVPKSGIDRIVSRRELDDAKVLNDRLSLLEKKDREAFGAWNELLEKARSTGAPLPPRPVEKVTGIECFALKKAQAYLRASSLYNDRIHPLTPMNIKGVLWYQGESNARHPSNYAPLMCELIQGWREAWGKQFPFIMVSLARCSGPTAWDINGFGSFALIREAQIAVTGEISGTGVVSSADVDKSCIHPTNKKPVGQRSALWALEHVYGKAVISSGPVFGKVSFTAGKAIIEMPKGPYSKGLSLTGTGSFTLAGDNQKFVSATATLVNGNIEVISPSIAQPVALRYAFVNEPNLTVFNSEGLPALPFRTDQWPVAPEINFNITEDVQK
jgi:sialate O-acetylesterase